MTILGIGETPTPLDMHASANGVDNAGSVPIDGLVNFEWRLPEEELVNGDSVEVLAVDGYRCSLVIRVDGEFRIRPRVSVVKRDRYA